MVEIDSEIEKKFILGRKCFIKIAASQHKIDRQIIYFICVVDCDSKILNTVHEP